MEKLKCLGCGEPAEMYFFLTLHHVKGPQAKSRTFGVCDTCSNPGPNKDPQISDCMGPYEKFRMRLGTVLFMLKNNFAGNLVNKSPAGES